MSAEVADIIYSMDLGAIQSQLALQCAPLIVGLKISNLFVTSTHNIRALRKTLSGSGLSFYLLTSSASKATFFVYKEKCMLKYLHEPEVNAFLSEYGYTNNTNLTDIFLEFRRRYAAYQRGEGGFPHEMGVFLGYPIEDVRGFIENDGQGYLYSGYWKVYEGVDEKKDTFELYEIAKETLVCLISSGIDISEIIETYCGDIAA